jgi:prenyltransferase beta subunit
MNRDEICRMAEESTPDQMIGGFGFDYEQLLHFAALVAAAERQAIIDELQNWHRTDKHRHNHWLFAINYIQGRGQQ